MSEDRKNLGAVRECLACRKSVDVECECEWVAGYGFLICRKCISSAFLLLAANQLKEDCQIKIAKQEYLKKVKKLLSGHPFQSKIVRQIEDYYVNGDS